MDRDGKNKRDLTEGSREFAYGFSASKDGRRIAYHKSYQVYVADADGSNARHIATGHPFNFAPQWSPDGTHLLFVAGEHENCHPYVANADGTGLRKLADRNGYRGVMEFLDVPDFHSGSSDIPAWSTDGTIVYYTAKVGANVELFRVSLDGRIEQLTRTPARLAPLPPNALAGRALPGVWIAAGRRPAALRLAARGPIRAAAHRPGSRPRGHVAALAADTRRITAHRVAKLPATTVLTSVGYVVQTDLVAKSIGDGGRPVKDPGFRRSRETLPVQDCDAPLRAPPAVRLADRVPRGRDAVRTVPARAAGLIASDRVWPPSRIDPTPPRNPRGTRRTTA